MQHLTWLRQRTRDVEKTWIRRASVLESSELEWRLGARDPDHLWWRVSRWNCGWYLTVLPSVSRSQPLFWDFIKWPKLDSNSSQISMMVRIQKALLEGALAIRPPRAHMIRNKHRIYNDKFNWFSAIKLAPLELTASKICTHTLCTDGQLLWEAFYSSLFHCNAILIFQNSRNLNTSFPIPRPKKSF